MFSAFYFSLLKHRVAMALSQGDAVSFADTNLNMENQFGAFAVRLKPTCNIGILQVASRLFNQYSYVKTMFVLWFVR